MFRCVHACVSLSMCGCQCMWGSVCFHAHTRAMCTHVYASVLVGMQGVRFSYFQKKKFLLLQSLMVIDFKVREKK